MANKQFNIGSCSIFVDDKLQKYNSIYVPYMENSRIRCESFNKRYQKTMKDSKNYCKDFMTIVSEEIDAMILYAVRLLEKEGLCMYKEVFEHRYREEYFDYTKCLNPILDGIEKIMIESENLEVIRQLKAMGRGNFVGGGTNFPSALIGMVAAKGLNVTKNAIFNTAGQVKNNLYINKQYYNLLCSAKTKESLQTCFEKCYRGVFLACMEEFFQEDKDINVVFDKVKADRVFESVNTKTGVQAIETVLESIKEYPYDGKYFYKLYQLVEAEDGNICEVESLAQYFGQTIAISRAKILDIMGRYHKNVRFLPDETIEQKKYKIKALESVLSELKNNQANEKDINEVNTEYKRINSLYSKIEKEYKNYYDTALDFYFGRNALTKNYKKAFDLFEKVASSEASCKFSAIDWVGVCYFYGNGVDQNYEKAAECLTKDLKQEKSAEAMKCLANLYFEGIGIKKDIMQAFEWYKKGIKDNDTDTKSMVNLAKIYLGNMGIPADISKAIKLYRRAIELGNIDAMIGLGNLYLESLDKNEKDEGAELLFKVAESYCSGKSGEKDYTSAIKFYLKSAENGNGKAQYALAVCYDKGRGIVKDAKQAMHWYQKASYNNNAQAQYELGMRYLSDEDKSEEEAIIWLEKAANLGNEQATKKVLELRKIREVKEFGKRNILSLLLGGIVCAICLMIFKKNIMIAAFGFSTTALLIMHNEPINDFFVFIKKACATIFVGAFTLLFYNTCAEFVKLNHYIIDSIVVFIIAAAIGQWLYDLKEVKKFKNIVKMLGRFFMGISYFALGLLVYALIKFLGFSVTTSVIVADILYTLVMWGMLVDND